MSDFRARYLYWFNHYIRYKTCAVASCMAYRKVARSYRRIAVSVDDV